MTDNTPTANSHTANSPTTNSSLTGNNKLQHDRQHDIYLLALRHGSVEVAELARRYAVTTETIRRDLSELQELGRIKRVHGGAVPIERAHHEPTIEARDMQNPVEKLQIAYAALAEVPTRGTVLIDSGSTLQRLAEVFPATSDLHVITNSMLTGLQLNKRGVDNLTLLGGKVRTSTHAAVDTRTVDAVRAMQFDVLFISCDGLSFNRGLTTPYGEEASLKRAMIENSRRVVALADHSKIGNGQLYSYAALDELDVLIVDDGVDADALQLLREQHVDVRVAGPEQLKSAS